MVQGCFDARENKSQYQVVQMSRIECAYLLKVHRIPDVSELCTAVVLSVDHRSHQAISRVPVSPDFTQDDVKPSQILVQDQTEDIFLRFPKKINQINFKDSSVRVIRVGDVDTLHLLNEVRDPSDEQQNEDYYGELLGKSRESKVPNIPLMIRCQNCDTNFPTKYQFQRHQCEFNADKVVLKPNVDARDVGKGLRMKFECKTCGKLFVSKNNLERHLTSHDEDNVNICEYCNKQFVSENRLRIHKENHCKKTGDISKFYRSDVTVWRCIKCYQVFSSDTYACTHAETCKDLITDPVAIKNANEDIAEVMDVKGEPKAAILSQYVDKVRTELLLQCEFCNRTYANKKSLLWHQDTHTTAVNYNCVVCDQNFESYTSAAKHWLTDCTNEANLFFLPKLIFCKCCNRTFKSHEVLYLHKIKKKHYTPKKHTDENDFQVEPKIEIKPIKKDVDVGSMKSGSNSSINNDDVNSDSGPIKKIKTEEEIKTLENAENGKTTIIQLIEGVLGSSKVEKNEGTDCPSENFDDDEDGDNLEDDDKSNVLVKSEINSEVSLGVSDDATEEPKQKKRGRKRKATSQNSKSKKYMIEVAQGYKYQCERCVALFSNVMELEVHRNKKHPANYKCEECDQVVHSSKALMIHSRAHQSLKPYVCEICKRCYSQTSHLWQHMRFHQGIKPFACPHEGCEARYTIRPDLKDHIRKVHTRERPFKCTVCDKCFLTGSVYYQHRLIHTNDRRYACDICEKRFFRADALNNHRRIHTDERPYPCMVCGRNFRQKGDRNKHVRTQHPDFHI
ncbi:zinc finger protein 431-like isoform X1 [Atheta coriaria]|uniref:zinc finger protein 431-like isoform X1 n=1 Tax=Dalotia coriaria TaxID=877792 RepID=UPI0031F44E4B